MTDLIMSIISLTSPPSFENGFSFLLAGDFDQTLSFNDSGYVLCELLGIKGFEEKVSGLVRRCQWDKIRTDWLTFHQIPPFVVNEIRANDSKLLPAASPRYPVLLTKSIGE
jgi:hypothetical protein